jgi:DNA-binding protein WhiA
VARKIFKLAKEIFDVQTEILVMKNNKLKKQNIYQVRIPPQEKVNTVLQSIGITSGGLLNFKDTFNADIVRKSCCRRAYLRGVFLGGGSVNSPEGTYHLEILTNDLYHAKAIVKIMQSFDLPAKITNRKNWHIVYLKGSENIVMFLNVIGAHRALMEFENVRVMKEVRNGVNRLVNCETANLNKMVDAASRQLQAIKYIQDTIGLDNLPPALEEVAILRLKNPEESLKELGEHCNPKLGKSGINHRMRKIEEIAEEIKNTT